MILIFILFSSSKIASLACYQKIWNSKKNGKNENVKPKLNRSHSFVDYCEVHAEIKVSN